MSTTSTGSSSRPDGPYAVPHRPAEIRRVLADLGVRPSKQRGQSFLVDPFVADAEAALVVEGPGGPVVEVGGGLGVLTEALLRRGVAPLTVIERDPALVGFLRRTFGGAVAVVEGDARELPLPPGSTIVGNLPFSVGTPILERVWQERLPRFVGMLQREVVDRMTAAPGSRVYGRLTIAAALYGTTQPYQPVPSAAFEPVPEVEGRVFGFAARSGELPVPSVPEFDRVLGALFGSRRKQLANLLPRLVPRDRAAATAAAAGWPAEWARLRPERLPPDAFFRLASVLAARPGSDAAPGLPRHRQS